MAGGNDEKTEKPTRERLRKARRKGQVARSKEVPSAAIFFGTLIFFFYFGKTFFHNLQHELQSGLSLQVPAELTVQYLTSLLRSISIRAGTTIIPVLLVVLCVSVFSNMAQGGLVVSTEGLKLKPEKLLPKNGINRIFSKNGLVEVCKCIVLTVTISYITYKVLIKNIEIYPRLVLMDIRKLIYWISSISFEVMIKYAILLIVLAIADYYFQKYRFKEQLKMSKQEVRDEFKDMEGDPTTKNRIRRIQRDLARKRMMADVPTADVIITNPTHYAIALSYKMDTMEAPKVVAKGVGFLAQKIKELAQEHKIPQVENKPLARALYKSVEVGEYIPGHLYRAVAEILAYVYKAKNALYR